MKEETVNQKLRQLPSVEELLSTPQLQKRIVQVSHVMVTTGCREVLSKLRETILNGDLVPKLDDIIEKVEETLQSRFSFSLQKVINGTGVILHTNLGRAPLGREVMQHLTEVAENYNNLEMELNSGKRGQRGVLVEQYLKELTGAEAGLVVNNNAGAVLLILQALTSGKEVIISRGELVQIGGGFRIPEILSLSGAILKEIGTTNQTLLEDYKNAISENTACLLKVHHSNFKMEGFVKETALEELVKLGQKQDLVTIFDLGSGALLDTKQFGLAHEPTIQEAVQSGVDLVAFSGDKLLGGPQAGIIVGKKVFVEKLKKYPLYRALRVAKLTLSVLEITLLHYLKREATEKIPIWKMISTSNDNLKSRGEKIIQKSKNQKITLKESQSFLGGGSLPQQSLPTYVLSFDSGSAPEILSEKFRKLRPPVIGRIEDEKFVLDLRTVFPEQDDLMVESIRKVLA
ncbi:MAG TPA: L-seryl-tRNA(Sec) selenium transferase [candidate division Zixibacteria bacterium]|nr:L-seryl-tRNA(Sec) selenium transferase [candidate division Zixibacteria bacterium]